MVTYASFSLASHAVFDSVSMAFAKETFTQGFFCDNILLFDIPFLVPRNPSGSSILLASLLSSYPSQFGDDRVSVV